jgi:hypothetical protein
MERDEKGRLQKGHGGLKPKGAVSERTEMWNRLGEYVVTQGAERAMQVLGAMEDEEFLKNYMTMLEYFKPKQGRTVHASDTDSPVVIQIHGNI